MSNEQNVAKQPLTKEEKRNRVLMIILSSIVVLLILGGFIFGSPYSIKKNGYSSFEKMITENYDKPTVLYCTKPSCTYCDEVTPLISQIKDEYGDEVNFYCIDVLDEGEGSELWAKYKPKDGSIQEGKTGVPCVIYIYARTSPSDSIVVADRVVGWGGKYEKNSYNDINSRVKALLSYSKNN